MIPQRCWSERLLPKLFQTFQFHSTSSFSRFIVIKSHCWRKWNGIYLYIVLVMAANCVFRITIFVFIFIIFLLYLWWQQSVDNSICSLKAQQVWAFLDLQQLLHYCERTPFTLQCKVFLSFSLIYSFYHVSLHFDNTS